MLFLLLYFFSLFVVEAQNPQRLLSAPGHYFYPHVHRTLCDGNASSILGKRGIIVDKRKGRENKEAKMTLTKTQDVLFGREFKRADRAGHK